MNSFSIDTEFLYGHKSLSILEEIRGKKIWVFIENDSINIYNENIYPYIHNNSIDYVFFNSNIYYSTEDIEAQVFDLIQARPDYILSFGGADLVNYSKIIRFYSMETALMLRREEDFFPSFIIIPLNLAGGVEASNVAFMVDRLNRSSTLIIDDLNTADYLIINEDLISPEPGWDIKHMAFIGLCNSIDSYISINSNPFSNMQALNSIDIFNKYILLMDRRTALKNKISQLQLASVMGGFSTKLSSLGLGFIFALSLNKYLGIDLAQAYSLAMPQLIKYNAGNNFYLARYSNIAQHLGFNYNDDFLNHQALVENLKYIARHLDLATSLSHLEVDYGSLIEEIDLLAQDIFSNIGLLEGYDRVSIEDIRRIILSMV